MKITFSNIFILFLLAHCGHVSQNDIQGLWQVVDVNVDGLRKNYNPTYILLNDDLSFAASLKTGDVLGLYTLNNGQLAFQSDDQAWYQGIWKTRYFKDTLVLSGLDIPYRTTHITYTRTKRLPNFEEFEQTVLGQWQLYKVMKSDKKEKLDSTFFEISKNGFYLIKKGKEVLAQGAIEIDARHQKIIFKDDKTVWNVWFYGNELRITNSKIGIQYCLRR